MSRTTTALVLREIGQPLVSETVQLSALRPEEALVEVHATGICHTDISCQDGTLPTAVPAVLGHEGAGVVLEIGSGISHVSPGDKVLLSSSHCQQCNNCQSGHPHYCQESMARNFGGRRIDGTATISIGDDQTDQGTDVYSSFFGQSSFARHAVVNSACLIKVPPETNIALLAPLGCGVSTGVGSIHNTLNVQAGDSVAVFGAGSVGLSAVMGAKLREARIIVAVDLSDERLAIAKTVGATHAFNAGKDNVVEKVKAATSSVGVDYAVDCTGVSGVIGTMMECLKVRGRAAQVGIGPPDRTAPINILQHIVRGQEFVGCAGGDTDPNKVRSAACRQSSTMD